MARNSPKIPRAKIPRTPGGKAPPISPRILPNVKGFKNMSTPLKLPRGAKR